MFSTTETSQTFRVIGIAASPAAPLAILSIAGLLGIGPRQAADHLASLPTVLADSVAAPDAQLLSALLSALGVRVRLDPTFQPTASAGPTARPRDMALQPIGQIATAVVDRLSARLALSPAEVEAGLSGPEGLVLRGLPCNEVSRLRAELRPHRTLRIVLSDPETATYDMFTKGNFAEVRREISRLGLGRCAFSGAAAAGMNRPTARYLARRLSGQTMILNRDFQRYDLFLPVNEVPVPKEFSDFLMTRQAMSKTSEVAVQDKCLRRVESDLSRSVAMEFAADYVLIGMPVEARVRGARG